MNLKKKQKEVQADSEVPENDDVLTKYLDQASEERDDDFTPPDSVKDAYNEFYEQ